LAEAFAAWGSSAVEDMPLGPLSQIVKELESSEDSLARHFGICPNCGCKDRYRERVFSYQGSNRFEMLVHCSNCKRLIDVVDVP
jgi:hypothetical protein